MSDPTAETRLAEIRERADAAMPGPWAADSTGRVTAEIPPDPDSLYPQTRLEDIGGGNFGGEGGGYSMEAANAEFIAHVREDIPFLLDLVAGLVVVTPEATVDDVAQHIRFVDGAHDLGAARLADALLAEFTISPRVTGTGKDK